MTSTDKSDNFRQNVYTQLNKQQTTGKEAFGQKVWTRKARF